MQLGKLSANFPFFTFTAFCRFRRLAYISNMRKVSIIGVGRLGGALAIALAEKGYWIENLVVRKKESAEKVAELVEPKPKILFFEEFTEVSSEIIFIAAQDFKIESVAEELAERLQNKPFVFHTSGSLSSEILYKLQQKGCSVGSIHPLVSVSSQILGADRFAGAFFCVEGDKRAVEAAAKIVSDLEGKFFTLETRFKALYHAAAVTASGHFVALIDVALEMFSECGVEKEKAQEILLPLIKSTVGNLENQTTAQALTGTFARADVEIFEKHLQILEKSVSEQILEIYLSLAARSILLAEQQGANREKVEEIQRKISLAKKKIK